MTEASGASREPGSSPDPKPSEPPTGWATPDTGPSRRRPLLIGVLLVGALLIVGPLVATFVLDQTGSSGPDMQTVGFGTGGSECSLTDVASSFQLGVPIRSVVTFSPALPSGGTITIRLEHDGTELVDRRQTLTLDEPAPCVYATMTPEEVGHYRVEYTIDPSEMPPIVGEFDVTR